MSEDFVIPIHAQGFFVVCSDGTVHQVVTFDYYDPDQYYAELEEEGGLEEELEVMAARMQSFLDEEVVKISGKRVRPTVEMVDLVYRGSRTRPSVTFVIMFRGRLTPGLNRYENEYESEVVEYDYEVYWLLPPGARVVEVELDGVVDVIDGRIVVARVARGERLRGKEVIVFEL